MQWHWASYICTFRSCSSQYLHGGSGVFFFPVVPNEIIWSGQRLNRFVETVSILKWLFWTKTDINPYAVDGRWWQWGHEPLLAAHANQLNKNSHSFDWLNGGDRLSHNYPYTQLQSELNPLNGFIVQHSTFGHYYVIILRSIQLGAKNSNNSIVFFVGGFCPKTQFVHIENIPQAICTHLAFKTITFNHHPKIFNLQGVFCSCFAVYALLCSVYEIWENMELEPGACWMFCTNAT